MLNSPTTERGLIGHFPWGVDLPALYQHISPRLSSDRHIRPYDRYPQPGPGEEDHGAAQADAGDHGTVDMGRGWQGGEPEAAGERGAEE